MQKYRITAPDGGTYEITAPEGATEAQALEYAKANYNKAAAPQESAAPYKPFTKEGAFLLGAGQSIPITDEIGAALGTPVAKAFLEARAAFTGDEVPSMGELYSRELNKTRGQIKQAASDNPLESYGGMIAGSIGTGLAGAGAKGTTVLANSLRSGGLPMRALKGAAAGATSGGLYGFGAGEGGLDERLSTAGEGATAGLVLGGALPVVGAGIQSAIGGTKNAIAGAGARGIEQLDESLSALRTQKQAAYQKVRELGAVIKPDAASSLAGKIDSAVKASGAPNEKLHGQALAALDDLKSILSSGNASLDDIENARVVLGQIERSPTDKTNAFKASVIKDALDDALDDLTDTSFVRSGKESIQAVKEARKANVVYRKSEMISDVIAKADGDPNKIKAGLQRLAVDKRKMRGFNKQEKAAILDAARNTTGEKLLKMAGKFGIDFGSSITPGNTLLPALGGYLGSPGLVAGGTAARGGQKLIARGKAENLLRAIEGGNVPFSKQAPQIGGGAGAIGGAPAAGILGGVDSPPVIDKPVPMGQPSISVTPEVNQPSFVPAPQSSIAPSPLFYKIVGAEASGDMKIGKHYPNDPSKTASGPVGFIDQTWNDLVKKYGAQYGVTKEMRGNPQAEIAMFNALENETRMALVPKLGREPTEGELYVAHVMGEPQGARILKMRGSRELAARIFPTEAKANRPIFFDGKRPRTVQEVIAILERKVS